MKLSIVIPFWNAEPYTSELLNALSPQMRKGVECIVIDDGSPKPFKTNHKWVKVFRKENGGAATARNMGMDKAKGEYISFIDADDLVPEYFVDRLLSEIEKTRADVYDFSWKSLDRNGSQHNCKLKSDHDFLTNPSVCTRAFKRSFIGDTRFNEMKDSTEDEDFSRRAGYLHGEREFKHVSITDYMYFYRTSVSNSKVKRFKNGQTKTKRVAYYYPKVTKDMTWLYEEIKKEDMTNEVYLITNYCEFPDMWKYSRLTKPGTPLWTHYMRGEEYNRITIIPLPYDVVIYTGTIRLNGLSTFIKEWCEMFSDLRVLVLYDNKTTDISFNAECRMNNKNNQIICDTLIINSLFDKIPSNITYKKSVQMCHACKRKDLSLPQNRDYIINVSESSKKTWNSSGVVIHNPHITPKKKLMLVSTARIGASDKGQNDKRMVKLCEMLNAAKIDFTWLNFSDTKLNNPPKNFINCPPTPNVVDIIRRADYSVLLSDQEAYPYQILESLSVGTSILSCSHESIAEMGFKDEIMGYIIPPDMDFDVTELLNVPEFEFDYSSENKKIKKQWTNILKSTPPQKEMVTVVATKQYKDLELNRIIKEGARIEVTKERAKYLVEDRNLCKRA